MGLEFAVVAEGKVTKKQWRKTMNFGYERKMKVGMLGLEKQFEVG